MKSFQVYQSLAWLNDLPAGDAHAAFLDCCGSQRWAERMTSQRPYRMLEDLYSTAEATWYSMTPADRLEAFAAHPKIGSSTSTSSRTGKWSAQEQAAASNGAGDLKQQLAEANRLYEEKFGFIFIVCATGRRAPDLLADCRARLNNSLSDELKIATDEQHLITVLRLNKLLEK